MKGRIAVQLSEEAYLRQQLKKYNPTCSDDEINEMADYALGRAQGPIPDPVFAERLKHRIRLKAIKMKEEKYG
jgi:ribosomal protein S10